MERDRAIEQLQKAFADRDPLLQYIAVESYLDGMKSDARFQAILAQMGMSRALVARAAIS